MDNLTRTHTQHLRAMSDEELVPLVAARLEEDGLAKSGAEGLEFVQYATQVCWSCGAWTDERASMCGPFVRSFIHLPTCVRLRTGG